MKIYQSSFNSRNRRNGSAVVLFLALLAIMLLLVAANSKALFQLHQEARLLNRRQIERLDASQTNVMTAAASPINSETK
jgi:hypothetical protein